MDNDIHEMCLHCTSGEGGSYLPFLSTKAIVASFCFVAAAEAQVQWCGEDQDHWQHLHGCSRAQCPLRTREPGTPGLCKCKYYRLSLVLAPY